MAVIQSFETDLSGWSSIGEVSQSLPVTSDGDVGATDGTHVAKLVGQGATQEELESFLGLKQNALNEQHGNVIDGSALKITLDLQAGEIFQFDWYFDTTDTFPNNDYSFFTSVQGPLDQLADVKEVDDFGGSSGWQTYTFTAS